MLETQVGERLPTRVRGMYWMCDRNLMESRDFDT